MPVQCTCQRCGQPFAVVPYRAATARFCSVACKDGPQAVCICQTCGDAYAVKSSHAAGSRYCSRPCRHLGDRARTAPLVDRFWARVDTVSECWLWTGRIGPYGYGELAAGHVGHIKAHRLAWTLETGDTLSSEVDICHTCDVRHCVRNDEVGTYEVDGVLYKRRGHLWLGDHAANIKDMVAKGRHGSTVRPERLPRGVDHPHSKLNEVEVMAIRERSAAGERHNRLAAEFGIDPNHVTNIVKRRSWAHL